MTEENTSGESTSAPVENTEDKVAYSTYKKVLTEKKNLHERMRSLQDQVDAINKEKQSSEQKKLEEQGEYKKILEIRQKEVEAMKADNELLAKELQHTWKKQAFYGKLKGSLRKPEYEQFIDLETIALDPESHQVNPESVDIAVNQFMEKYGDLVAQTAAKTIPGQAPQHYAPKSIGSMNSAEKQDALKGALTNLLTAR